MAKQKEHKIKNFYRSLRMQIRTNKTAFIWYMVLRILVIVGLIRQVFLGNFAQAFLCALVLILFLLPPFVETRLKIELPTTLEIVIYCFIFAAEILGEIGNFYVRIPGWDTVLHTVWGFLCAAIGFALVDILNQSHKFKFELSPLFLAIVAFCFSMTIGVLWEFFEFAMDSFFTMDMQKDFIIQKFASVSLDPTLSNIPVVVQDIVETQIVLQDGSVVVVSGGYLDIGIIDTMKDLFVNFIGALTFSVIGYFYVKERGQGKIAKQFIPVLITESQSASENAAQEEASAQTENCSERFDLEECSAKAGESAAEEEECGGAEK